MSIHIFLDNFLDRTHRTLELSSPSQRDVESLQNWLDGTGAVARDERVYLTHFQDLVTVAPTGDTAVVRLETWIEDKMIRYYGSFRKVHQYPPWLPPEANI